MLIICLTTIVKKPSHSTQPPLTSSIPDSELNVEEHLEKKQKFGQKLVVLCVIIGASLFIYLFHFPKKVGKILIKDYQVDKLLVVLMVLLHNFNFIINMVVFAIYNQNVICFNNLTNTCSGRKSQRYLPNA